MNQYKVIYHETEYDRNKETIIEAPTVELAVASFRMTHENNSFCKYIIKSVSEVEE